MIFRSLTFERAGSHWALLNEFFEQSQQGETLSSGPPGRRTKHRRTSPSNPPEFCQLIVPADSLIDICDKEIQLLTLLSSDPALDLGLRARGQLAGWLAYLCALSQWICMYVCLRMRARSAEQTRASQRGPACERRPASRQTSSRPEISRRALPLALLD